MKKVSGQIYCHAVTHAELPTVTYVDGEAGFTLTAGLNGILGAQGGVIMREKYRLLVKNQTDAFLNGVYFVTTLGDETKPFVLTRVEK